MVPTVVLANMSPNGPSARCGQLNIGDQIISVNGISLVGLPLSTCQTYIKVSMSCLLTKPVKWHVRPVWLESSLSAWRKLGSLASPWVHSEGPDQTGQMPRLIWVFAGLICHFVDFVTRRLVLFCAKQHVILWHGNYNWTASSEFGTYRICEQRRFRRACPLAQSRQNLRCSLIQAMSQEEPSDRKPDHWPLWMAGHAQLKFVMMECSKTQIRLTGLN